LAGETIRINEVNGNSKREKRLRKQIKGKFNNVGSDDDPV
jgi:hypothetical protein